MESYLRGTTVSIGDVSRVAGQISFSLDTRGAHTGISRTTGGGTGAGSFSNNSATSAGNHGHSSNILTESQLSLARINFVAMEMTSAQLFLPTHAVFTNNGYFSATTHHNDAEFFSLYGNPYIYIGNTWSTAETAPVSSTSIISTGTGTAGPHIHHVANRNAFATGAATQGFMVSAGLHSHTVQARFNQSAVASTKRLSLQLSRSVSSTQRGPRTGMIMPYVGSVANIPAPWFLCNGNNGTVDMNNWFPAARANTGQAFNSIFGDNTTYSDISQPSPAWGHTHYSSSLLAGAGIAGFHDSFDAAHTHILTTFVDALHVPAHRRLFFIQYMG
jgi:hypothetical protein